MRDIRAMSARARRAYMFAYGTELPLFTRYDVDDIASLFLDMRAGTPERAAHLLSMRRDYFRFVPLIFMRYFRDACCDARMLL